jgi:hypothetical protein
LWAEAECLFLRTEGLAVLLTKPSMTWLLLFLLLDELITFPY